MAEPIIDEYQLDNPWRVTYTPENPMDDGTPYSVRVDVERNNGGDWEYIIGGQVKQTGCSDWGFGRQVLWHGCGAKDVTLMETVYKRACEIGGYEG